MPRGIPRVIAPVVAEEQESLPMNSEQAEAADVIEFQAEALNKSPTTRIYRIGFDGKESFLDAVSTSIVSEEWIAETYGGGKYVAKNYAVDLNRPKRKYGYVSQSHHTVDMGRPSKGPLSEQHKIGAPVPTLAPAMASGTNSLDVLMIQQIMEMVKDSQEARQRSADQAASQAREHSTVMATLLDKMNNRPDPFTTFMPLITALVPVIVPMLVNRKSPMELATEIVKVQKDASGPQRGIGEIVSLMKDLRELGLVTPKIGGDDDEEGGGMLKIAAPLIGKLLDTLNRGTLPAADANAVTAAAPSDEAPAPTVVQDEWSSLEPHAARLAQWAKAGKVPSNVAYTILTLFPEEEIGVLHEMLRDDGLAARLMQRFPVLAPYPGWVSELLDALRDELFGEPDDEEPDPKTPNTGTQK